VIAGDAEIRSHGVVAQRGSATACASTGTCRSRWTTAWCCAPTSYPGPIAEGRYPVILSYGPYAKGLAFQDGYPSAWERMDWSIPTSPPARATRRYQSWEVVDPEKWVPHHYACVRVDSRGCGCSPGFIDHFSPRETKDFYDCIEWAGVQPWSNGKVGLNGISYYGINQWHVASAEPPHLAAMCIWEGAADWYRDMTHHGGILCTFWANWYDMQVKTVQYGTGERGKRSRVHGELVCGPESSEEELANGTAAISAPTSSPIRSTTLSPARSPVWSKVKVPFFSAANWGGQGLHPRGNFEGFVRAASKQKWLEVHGIEHWTHFYTDYGRNLQLRFFDHFLHGKTQRLGQAAAGAACRSATSIASSSAENEWPIKRTQWTRFYLDPSSGALADKPPPKKTALSFAASATASPSSPRRCRGRDRDHRSDRRLQAFRLVLDQRCRHFRGAARFLARSQGSRIPGRHRSAHAGRPGLAARLASPARQETVIALPALSHPRRKNEPLKPGEVVELDIEIWPTSIVVPAGYRVALTIRGKDYVYPGGERRAAVEFQERADRLRAVPARRRARPSAADFRRLLRRLCGAAIHRAGDRVEHPRRLYRLREFRHRRRSSRSAPTARWCCTS
jgi:uncharacterized protein